MLSKATYASPLLILIYSNVQINKRRRYFPFLSFKYVFVSASFSGSSLTMTEFWLISAPGEKTCQQTWDKMMTATTRTNNLSTNHKFSIPDLKVSTVYWLNYLPVVDFCHPDMQNFCPGLITNQHNVNETYDT